MAGRCPYFLGKLFAKAVVEHRKHEAVIYVPQTAKRFSIGSLLEFFFLAAVIHTYRDMAYFEDGEAEVCHMLTWFAL